MMTSVLRFVTAGSVDDGKSTLIGRLLFDSKGIFADQLEALTRAKHQRTCGEDIDLSLLTDGLEAEREQGITIDVAYRYFSTPRRKFIIADAPGHEQYTRNMVTGASTADAMILLIDAAKVKESLQQGQGLLLQTKRHSTIAQILQIRHIIIAINKMDLVNFDQNVYEYIIKAYAEFAQSLGLSNIHTLPLSALLGDNVVVSSNHMPWYKGPSLIELLESLSLYDAKAKDQALRFPVQWVARHQGSETNDFRGYMGRIEAGKVRKGETLSVQPSGQSATVTEILSFNTSLESAESGQSVTLLLKEHLDISRGDMLVSAGHPPTLLKNVQADICWLSERPLDLRHRYWLKHTSKQTLARVTDIQSCLDINTQQRHPTESLKLNDIARISLHLQQSISADAYDYSRATGAFILIDEVTHQTAAAGMIRLDTGAQN
ncbi:MAG TPA: GTP-binding protein [Pseudobdellovibrionaceae bacterium]|jgi:sulfate adenylyltransferase subunit 1